MAGYSYHSGARCASGLLVTAFALVFLQAPAPGQEAAPSGETPAITRITPTVAAPETGIQIEGYRLGANLETGVRVLFVQGGVEHEATWHGGGYEAGNVNQGPQGLAVWVPEQFQPGPCQVMVEVNGQRSAATTIQINDPATAPKLTGFNTPLPHPGEMLWIKGTGFSESDDFELTDAAGQTHHFHAGPTSDANTAAFPLPNDLPGGEATLRVIERRSGTNQASNALSINLGAR